MTKTVAIIISPNAQIRGTFPNIPKIFKIFGFRYLIPVGSTNNIAIVQTLSKSEAELAYIRSKLKEVSEKYFSWRSYCKKDITCL
jgi:hypothetical protein